MDSLQELSENEDRSDRLARFDAGIDAILSEGLGQDWLLSGPEDDERLLTSRQRDWQELRYFYEASKVNSGDLFAYLSMIYSQPELFKQIGAMKTLAAAEELKSYYEAYCNLTSHAQKEEYLKNTREQRELIEWQAEDMDEFTDLLIHSAESHPDEFPELEAQNPSDRFSAVINTVRRMATEAGIDTKELDLAVAQSDQLNGDTILSHDSEK